MTISCEQCREWLSDLLEDETPGQTQPASRLLQPAADPSANGASVSHAPSHAILLAHVVICADCACDLNMLRNLRSELRVLPRLDAPADLRAKVRAQLTASPSSAPLLVTPVAGAETLNQVPSANGHYRPTPQYTPAQPSFIANLARFFSRPTNVAWASSAALAAFCLVLFTREQPHIVMPPAAPAATPSTAIAVAPQVNKSGHHNAVATTPGKRLASAATAKPPKAPMTNDTSPAPDAALTTPPATASHSSERTNVRHGSTRQDSDGRHAANHQATTAANSYINHAAQHGKAATAGMAATSTPTGDNSSHTTPPATTGTPLAPGQNASSGLTTQASDANPPFARLSLFAANDTTNQGNSSQSPTAVEPVPDGPGATNVVPVGPSTPNVETPTAVTPGATTNDVAPPDTNSRIAINPGRAIKFGAPRVHPKDFGSAKPTLPPLNFGLVGAERAAHLVVMPPHDIQAARLDIELSSGLRYADQTNGERRTVWHGAAQQGHPIRVDLHLVAIAAGTQQVKVLLMEVAETGTTGDTEDDKLAQSEKLNLNVTAPNGTTP